MSTDTDRVERIAELAAKHELRVVTAESLTSGTVATRLGAGPSAADWFGGGIVAYQERCACCTLVSLCRAPVWGAPTRARASRQGR
jgi:nicotinamide mononucleotide (NMN) deamidase PncC